jgi:hypothetical protein
MFLLIVLSLIAVHCTALEPAYYQCSYCLSTLDKVLEGISMSEACSIFPDNFCGVIQHANLDDLLVTKDSRKTCRSLNFCPTETIPVTAAAAEDVIDIRVTKALGSKGYNKLRVSVISNSTLSDELFTYSSAFKYRWTGKYLSSGIVTINPGEKSKFSVAGKEIEIFLPKEGEGVRGVIIADPCITSDWIVCGYQNKFQTFERTTQLLNAIGAFDDVHFYQILGDNFYDQSGDASSSWFQSLSTAMKAKFFSTVPGNHDFWVNASPKLWVPKDQLGTGFMQFYGQDTVASLADSTEATPFDFSADPDGKNKGF